jgi:hypothetical protein
LSVLDIAFGNRVNRGILQEQTLGGRIQGERDRSQQQNF